MTTLERQIEEARKWFDSSRFDGIVLLYSPRQVAEQQGSIQSNYGHGQGLDAVSASGAV